MFRLECRTPGASRLLYCSHVLPSGSRFYLTDLLQGWTTQMTLSTMMLILTHGHLHLTPAGLGESTRSMGQFHSVTPICHNSLYETRMRTVSTLADFLSWNPSLHQP